MSVPIEFVGGPRDGEQRLLAHPIWELRLPVRPARLAEPLPPLTYRRRAERRFDGVYLYDFEP